MTWFMVSMGAQGTHHGVLAGGRVLTDCGRAFQASEAVRLDLAPGEKPPDPDQICPRCDPAGGAQ